MAWARAYDAKSWIHKMVDYARSPLREALIVQRYGFPPNCVGPQRRINSLFAESDQWRASTEAAATIMEETQCERIWRKREPRERRGATANGGREEMTNSGVYIETLANIKRPKRHTQPNIHGFSSACARGRKEIFHVVPYEIIIFINVFFSDRNVFNKWSTFWWALQMVLRHCKSSVGDTRRHSPAADCDGEPKSRVMIPLRRLYCSISAPLARSPCADGRQPTVRIDEITFHLVARRRRPLLVASPPRSVPMIDTQCEQQFRLVISFCLDTHSGWLHCMNHFDEFASENTTMGRKSISIDPITLEMAHKSVQSANQAEE